MKVKMHGHPSEPTRLNCSRRGNEADKARRHGVGFRLLTSAATGGECLRNSLATIALLSGLAACTTAVAADNPIPSNTVAQMPVKEVTVFKDGLAFVLHEGRMPVTREGQVVMDYLPTPVIGTFWAYSKDKGTRLVSVTAGQHIARFEHTALTVREFLEANVGSECILTESNGTRYTATILSFPTRSSEELAATSPPQTGDRLPEKGNLVLLKTPNETRVLPVDRIQDVTFKQPPKTTAPTEEFRDYLTLKLDSGRRRLPREADLGLVYVQKGIRWIPSYKVDLDGKGKAVVRLQATVLNEMVDLTNVTLQLVVGVPSFYFKDTIDPIALHETAAQLSQFFQTEPGRGGSAFASNFGNAIAAQQVQPRMGGYRVSTSSEANIPALPEGARNEDLYVFTIHNFSLRKGDRVVLPILETTVPYADVYTLELPFAPPPEMMRNYGSPPQNELARLFAAPKVMHKVRLTNESAQPFTTAPALMLREGKVISQGLMTYTAAGASSDVALTTAVDIHAKKTDAETKRTPNAIKYNGDNYIRVDLDGKIQLTNYRADNVEVEVTRHVLGLVDSAGQDGKVELSNVFEDRDYLPARDYATGWPWNWYNWPWWWYHVNGVSRITWTVKLEPGKPVELAYAWHYFWR